MSTRLKVRSAILHGSGLSANEQLPKGEIRDLSKWLQEYLDQEWDREIEADFGAGKLDRLIAKAESDIANNQVLIWWANDVSNVFDSIALSVARYNRHSD